MFSHKITKSNGIAQFSIPKGSAVYARAEHYYQSEIANFSKVNDMNIAYISYPFENPTPLSSSKKYSFNMQILDSSSKPISNKKFVISSKSDSFNLSYLSDSYGFIKALSIPYSKIVLYWDVGTHGVSEDFDLSNLEKKKYTMDKLLKIHQPKITYIGESCYRVELNITDPRENALKQIDVKVIDGDESIAFTLEQNQIVDHSHILFNRVFCISKNTVFDIVATSPYEQEKLTVQLIRDFVPIENINYSDAPIDYSDIIEQRIPEDVRKKNEEQQRFELALILFEVLVILLALYVILRFRIKTFYYVQSISRFVHILLSSIIGKKSN